jgi:hypothetical protein
VATITIDFKEDWEGRMTRTFGLTAAIAAIVLSTIGSVSAAEKKYGPGVTDTEIKVGQTVPYSGPASAFSSYGRLMAGYFEMAQRIRRNQRPQGHADLARQRLQSPQGDRADAQAGRR